MNDQLRDAAARASVWQVIEQRAKQLKDEAKAELQALEAGDTVAGRINGQVVGKATMSRGRKRLVITDESQLLTFIRINHPTELVQSVNPAYLKALESKAKEVGLPIDDQGEFVPGVDIQEGDPYVSVRRDPNAEAVVAGLLAHGLVRMEGLRQQTPALEQTA